MKYCKFYICYCLLCSIISCWCFQVCIFPIFYQICMFWYNNLILYYVKRKARKVVSRKILIQQKYISTTSIHCSIKVGKWKFSSASYHSSVWFLFHIIKPSRDDVDIVCCINNMLFRQNYHYCWHVEVYIWIKDTQEKQKYIIRMVRKIFQCLSMLLAKKYYGATRLKLYWLHVIW